jgi:hypothetical protein
MQRENIPDQMILRSTFTWVLLVVLTLTSAFLGKSVSHPEWLLVAVVLIIMIKGYQIADVFMGLRYAPKGWRALLLSYVILVPAMIGILHWAL